MNGNQTYFFTLSCQVVDSFACSFRNRTHCNDYAFCIFSSVVIEQTVFTSCDLGDFIHIFFYDSRNCIIVRVARFSMLEEVVRVFSHTACNRSFRIQGTCAEFSQRLLVDQRSQIFIFQCFDLLDFVRCTETVEEVHERNTGFDCSQVGNTCQIHHFLYRTFGQHGEACLTGRHYVLMVTEDTQCVRSQCTSRYMEYARQQFTCDLVHVRDHQQQTLRSRISRSQCTSLQRTVNCTGSTTFRLHFLHHYSFAENILTSGSSPFIYIFCHRR